MNILKKNKYILTQTEVNFLHEISKKIFNIEIEEEELSTDMQDFWCIITKMIDEAVVVEPYDPTRLE